MPAEKRYFRRSFNGLPASPTPGAEMRTLFTVLAFALITPLAFAQKPETSPGAKVLLQLVTLSDSSYEKLIQDYPSLSADEKTGKRRVSLESAVELHQFTTALSTFRDVQILHSPIQPMMDGQTGFFTSGESRTFNYGKQQKDVDGKAVGLPTAETVFLGHTANVCPTIAQDRKTLSLRIQYSHTSVNPTPVRVTTDSGPTVEIGSQGEAIPIAPYVLCYPIDTTGIETTVKLPASSGVAVNLGTFQFQAENDLSPPVIAKIPYLNRLFKNATTQRESRHLLIVATASIVDIPAAKILVEDYHKAIAEGRIADAKTIGVKALAADPACFAK